MRGGLGRLWNFAVADSLGMGRAVAGLPVCWFRLRGESKELATRGFLNELGKPYAAKSEVEEGLLITGNRRGVAKRRHAWGVLPSH
jgi:hypothetical protein